MKSPWTYIPPSESEKKEFKEKHLQPVEDKITRQKGGIVELRKQESTFFYSTPVKKDNSKAEYEDPIEAGLTLSSSYSG